MDLDHLYEQLLEIFYTTSDDRKLMGGLEEDWLLDRLEERGFERYEACRGLRDLFMDDRGDFVNLGFYHEDRPWERFRSYFQVFTLCERLARWVTTRLKSGDHPEGCTLEELMDQVREWPSRETVTEAILREAIETLTRPYSPTARWDRRGRLVSC